MCRFHKKKHRVRRNSCCEGQVTTSWETLVIGGTAGIGFDAQVACESGDVAVRYLLCHADMKKMEAAEEVCSDSNSSAHRHRPNAIRQLIGRN